jgi:hypothetical protein
MDQLFVFAQAPGKAVFCNEARCDKEHKNKKTETDPCLCRNLHKQSDTAPTSLAIPVQTGTREIW